MSADHRSDIDGLRAIAVLPIVLFHAGVPGFPGGYVGVDIFFVISGYLITGLIRRDLDAGRFSLASFYSRRARRILPALLVVLAAATVAAWFLLLSWDMIVYGRTLLASATFWANFYFLSTAGYFDVGAETAPLLHIWSLAVEEQFYLVYPLLLVLIWRRWRRLVPFIVAGIALGSLVHAAMLVHAGNDDAFFLPTTRVWEFLAGALLALGLVPEVRRGPLAEILAVVAALAIAGAVALYGPATPFPGLAALPPVIGAAALIHLGPARTQVHRWLAWRPLVVVGLLSYSIYLWHWPIMAFWRYASFGRLGAGGAVVSLALTAVLSFLSWRFVERPFRARWFSSPKLVLPVSALAILPFIGAATAIASHYGFPDRLPPAALALEANGNDSNPRRAECLQRSAAPVPGHACRFGPEGAPVRIAVIGDSFADALMPAFTRIADARGVGGIILMRQGCFALLEIEAGNPRCRPMIRDAVATVAAMPDVDTVFLLSRWAAAAESSRFGVLTWSRYITDDRTVAPGFDDARRVFRDGLERIVAALKGKRVVLVYGIPEQPVIVPREAALNAFYGRDTPFAVTVEAFRARNAFLRATMADIAAKNGAVAIDLSDDLCPDGAYCHVLKDGRSLYADDNHLSTFGAESLVDSMTKRLAASGGLSAEPR